MGRRLLSLGTLAGLVAVTALGAASVEQTSRLERLAWMAGCWERTTEDRWMEEQWMVPRGDMMLGMSRTVRNGRVVGYEALRIERREGRLVYVANPSGQSVTEFAATGVGDEAVVFENPEHDFPQRISYRRHAGDSLVVGIEGRRNGEVRGIDLRFARARCPS